MRELTHAHSVHTAINTFCGRNWLWMA